MIPARSIPRQSQGDDVYNDGGPLSVTITEATVKDQVFEDLQLSKEPGVVQINDTTDTVTVSIAGNGDVFENANPTFTVSINQALKDDLTVKLSNGGTVTVKAGNTVAIYTAPVQGDDVYKDGGPLSVTITEATVKDQVFEDLQLSKEPGVVQINDTTDTVTVSIAGNGDVFENANPTFTVSINQALKDDLTVKLSNGGTVTVKAGDTSAIYTAPIQGDDVYKDGGPLSVTITEATVKDQVFEDLQLSKEPGDRINDTVASRWQRSCPRTRNPNFIAWTKVVEGRYWHRRGTMAVRLPSKPVIRARSTPRRSRARTSTKTAAR
ncbi:immunoglobulin-like domain-containing protein [Pseudomonas fluorescens]|uniref:immunoglobulin-like domain-containing protein n=1 Tax=Pseudomonas fluorescens TaxID=294 RepID=UPI003F954C4F